MRAKHAIRGTLCGCGLVLIVGCSGYDYSGLGNEFDITATVDHGGKHSVTVYDVHLNSGAGKGLTWWRAGTHQIHDNVTEDGSDKRVGYVCGLDCSEELPPKLLVKGQCVHITGKIRENHSGKSTWDEPVYDLVESCHHR